MMSEKQNTESKIEATHRLQREGRWDEASAHRDEQRERLRAEGLTKRDAGDEAWRLMIAAYPPLTEPPTTPMGSDDADLYSRMKKQAPSTSVKADLDWAYQHMGEREVDPADAPSRAAVGWQRFSVEEPRKFLELYMRHQPQDDREEEKATVGDRERMFALIRSVEARCPNCGRSSVDVTHDGTIDVSCFC